MKRKRKQGLGLTDEELAAMFAEPEWARQFPPILRPKAAARLLQIPLSTLYQWNSQRRLDDCWYPMGKHVRYFRNRLLIRLFNEGINE